MIVRVLVIAFTSAFHRGITASNTCTSLSEMVTAMKHVAEASNELSVEERNLLSVAYKNVIGARRASWRILSSIEQKEEQKDDLQKPKLALIREYREEVSSLEKFVSRNGSHQRSNYVSAFLKNYQIALKSIIKRCVLSVTV